MSVGHLRNARDQRAPGEGVVSRRLHKILFLFIKQILFTLKEYLCVKILYKYIYRISNRLRLPKAALAAKGHLLGTHVHLTNFFTLIKIAIKVNAV